MALRSAALWFLLWAHLVVSLQVTPDSPCAEFCIDSDDLDHTDPNSSTTEGSDIVCNDFEFSSEKAGKKYQRCMTCLQQSKFAKGAESDLDWFLYNLRYSFDYCVFGDMKAAGLDSNPCVTSEGCGGLTDALRSDMVNDTDRRQYGYCETDDKAISSDAFGKCLSCVTAEDTRSYVSNFLIALAIGCDQRPAPGHLLGLNETVFTKNTVQAVDPSNVGSEDDPNGGLLLSTTAIVGIAVGGFVLVLLTLGCVYIQFRKRKNRQRISGWSFRCQARSGSMPSRDVQEEEQRARFHEEMARGMWTSPSEKHVTGLIPEPPSSTMSAGAKPGKQGGVTTIITALPQPPALQTSGRHFHRSSPVQDEYTTPSSATSVRSNNPLLRNNESPASYSARSTYGHAVAANRGFSPQTPHSGGPRWEEQQRTVSASRPLTSHGGGRPGEVSNFGTNFPPPPPRR